MLTKTDLQSFLQCRRKLWLERKRPELIPKDDPIIYRRATDGRIVGEHARKELGPDCMAPAAMNDDAAAAEEAQRSLAASTGKPAAEVPMYYAGLYARADALVPETGGYVLRETKASTFPLKKDRVTPDKPENHHLNDVAIQAWVMKKSGLPMTRAELNLVNSSWRYPGGEEYSGLFRQMDVTVETQRRAKKVFRWQKDAEKILIGKMPTIATGEQCAKPYPCPFKTFCEPLDPPG